MTEFVYTALAKDGRRESSTIQAPTTTVAGHLLKEQGLLLTEIHENKKGKGLDFFKTMGTISLDEKINFVENLGIMLKAGISISRCLQIAFKQTKNPRFKLILSEVYDAVEQGKSLAEALSMYPKVFSNIIITMIKVGELSGNLDKSLEYLSNQLHREADLKSKTRGAMIYPSVIVGAMLIIGVLMSIFVLPSLVSTFQQFGGDLPFTTRVVIAFSNFMSGHAVIVLGGLIGAVVAVISFHRTYAGKRMFDVFFLHFYIINTIIKKVNLARFSRILSSMLKSGIPIVQGLEVASESLGNLPYRELVAESSNDVKLGKSLTQSLGKDTSLFPVLVVQMLEVGEESGTVQEILDQLALHYEEEVDNTLKNLSSIIEPLLLLIIGGVVGFLAMALIAPIYSISQTIS